VNPVRQQGRVPNTIEERSEHALRSSREDLDAQLFICCSAEICFDHQDIWQGGANVKPDSPAGANVKPPTGPSDDVCKRHRQVCATRGSLAFVLLKDSCVERATALILAVISLTKAKY